MERLGMTRIGEFDHPFLAEGHSLRPHVAYEIAPEEIHKT
jgi:RimJ/RimL family protein N-acetyltransferase